MGTVAYVQADAVFLFARWQHFYVQNYVMAAIFKFWHEIKNPTLLINAYLCKENSCEISSQSD